MIQTLKLCHLVTEGELDAQLLSKLMPESLAELNCVHAQGVSGAVSLARSLLVAVRQPVAVVVDSDTLEEREAHQKLDFIRESLSSVGGKVPFTVIGVMPELELIFIDTNLLKAILKKPLQDMEFDLAAAGPKRFLEKKLGKPVLRKILPKLGDAEITLLQKNPLVQHLTAFFNEIKTGKPRKTPAVLVINRARDN